jgi:hypothetical protein
MAEPASPNFPKVESELGPNSFEKNGFQLDRRRLILTETVSASGIRAQAERFHSG